MEVSTPRLRLEAILLNVNPNKNEKDNLNSHSSNVALGYRDIESASLGESRNGSPIIEIIFTEEGKRKLSELTTECLGKAIAIQVEGKLFSAPIVANPITGGKAQVTGNFSKDYAVKFISKLNEMVNKSE
ncbi:SecDF P1 head subdomain-containing protein [Coraliomargarita sp. W4R53]